MTQLYKVPNGSMVRVLEDDDGPPGAKVIRAGDRIKFHHIDGMYSFCHDKDGNIVHLKAWTEVEIINNDN